MNRNLYITLSIIATVLLVGNLVLFLLASDANEYPIRHLIMAVGIILLIFVLRKKPKKA
jgi:hypothetical protein